MLNISGNMQSRNFRLSAYMKTGWYKYVSFEYWTFLSDIWGPRYSPLKEVYLFGDQPIPFGGTLNVCLKMPDTMHKSRNWSDFPGLRKRRITVKNWVKSNFLCIISVFFDRINFSSFALSQAFLDTSFEYPERVIRRIFSLLT